MIAATKTWSEIAACGWDRVRAEAAPPAGQRETPRARGLRALSGARRCGTIRTSSQERHVRAGRPDSWSNRRLCETQQHGGPMSGSQPESPLVRCSDTTGSEKPWVKWCRECCCDPEKVAWVFQLALYRDESAHWLQHRFAPAVSAGRSGDWVLSALRSTAFASNSKAVHLLVQPVALLAIENSRGSWRRAAPAPSEFDRWLPARWWAEPWTRNR